MRSLSFISVLSVLLVHFAVGPVHAQDDEGYTKSTWPLQLVDRPIVLAPGMFQASGDTLRVNLSKDAALEPVSLAPDFFYGINRQWTVGITHGTGICLTGSDGGCPKAYNDMGLEVQFSLMGKGSFMLAATGGATVASFSDPFVAGLNFGFRVRMAAGKVAVVSHPRLYVGLAERDAFGDVAEIPVDVQYQLNGQTALILETGFAGALDDLGGANSIPLGFAGLFAINEKMDIGGALRLTNVAGTDGGIDGRELVGRFNLRL